MGIEGMGHNIRPGEERSARESQRLHLDAAEEVLGGDFIQDLLDKAERSELNEEDIKLLREKKDLIEEVLRKKHH